MADFILRPEFDPAVVIGLPVEEFDIEDVLLALDVHKELFLELTFRQVFEGTAHKHTETIYLRYAPYLTFNSIMQNADAVDYPAYGIPAFRELVEDVGDYLRKPLARAIIVKLAPHSIVATHTDEGVYADATDRWHLPLVTNDKCFMRSGEDTGEMKVGKLYAFDNHVPHSAYNLGDTPRIHLIVDVYR